MQRTDIRKNGRYWLFIILLLILVASSIVILGGKIISLTEAKAQTAISLQSSSSGSTSSSPEQNSNQTEYSESGRLPETQSGSSENRSDNILAENKAGDQQIWTTDTNIEIFRVSYENNENKVTVAGADKSAVIAPGTSNKYSFRICNTGNAAMDYTLSMEAYFGSDDKSIPVEVRLCDYNGKYLAGSASEWSPVLTLNDAEDSAVLAKQSYASYTLEWRWPFESNDEYDTFLGDSAMDEDITLTIVIHTVAVEDEIPTAGVGIPQTGDHSNILLWCVISFISLSAIVFLSLFKRSKKESADNDK